MVTIFYKTSSKCKDKYNAVTKIESNDVWESNVWGNVWVSNGKIIYRKDNVDESIRVRTNKGKIIYIKIVM